MRTSKKSDSDNHNTPLWDLIMVATFEKMVTLEVDLIGTMNLASPSDVNFINNY